MKIADARLKAANSRVEKKAGRMTEDNGCATDEDA
jgi:hypothetical protein